MAVDRGEERVDDRPRCPSTRRQGAAREVAAAAELREERALGADRGVGARVVDRGEPGAGLVVVGAALDRERALADLGQHHRRVEVLGRRGRRAPRRCERGRRDHDGVELAGAVEPGGDVAAQLGEGEVGSERGELGAPPHRAGRRRARRRAGRRASSRRARRAGRPARGPPRARCRRGRPTPGGPWPSAPRRRRARRARPAAPPSRRCRCRRPRGSARRCRTSPVGRDDHQLGVVAEQRDDPFGLPARQRAAARRPRGAGGASAVGIVGSTAPGARTARRARRRRARRGGAGRVLHPDGRLVQQLVDDAAGQLLDRVARGRGRARRAWRGAARARRRGRRRRARAAR